MTDSQPPTPHPDTLPADAEKLTGHCYDGIQEYDNPTPAWWTWIFMGSCVFAVIYLFYVFAAQGALSPHGQYERAYAANVEKQFGELGDLQADAATLIDLQTRDDGKWMAFGESVFKSNCGVCHGADAGGGSGPNLTDGSYIYVDSIEDIARVIREGEADGLMPPWEARMHPNQVVIVAAYVASLRDTNAPGGKAAHANDSVPEPWSAE